MQLDFEVVTDRDRLGAIANEVAQAETVGLDLETTSLDPRGGDVRILSLNTGRGVYVIDTWKTGRPDPVLEVLDNPEGKSERPIVIGQNLKFDQKWSYHHWGTTFWPVFDTFRASSVLHNGRKKSHDLDTLYQRELDIWTQTKAMGKEPWDGELSEEHLRYAAEDVTHLPAIRDSLRPKLLRSGLGRIALIEFGAIMVESAIELNGFRLDGEKWLALAEKNKAEVDRTRRAASKVHPHPRGQQSLFEEEGAIFNINSVPQVKASLARLGLNIDSTNRQMLAQHASEWPEVDALLAYRDAATKVNFFGADYLENISPYTGRIHAEYFPFTGAGRYSCKSPNLQQIPRDPAFRACFCVPEGKMLIGADYSQIELRIMAEISGDPVLRRLYREGLDVHRHTASIVLGVPFERVTGAQRQLAKPINFGLIYGLMPKKLVLYAKSNYGVNMTFAEARAFWERFFAEYQGVRAWQEETLQYDKPRRQTRTILGRRRFLDREEEHNSYFNTPVQGSGADGLKASMREVHRRLLPYGDAAKLVHMVHDELIIEADDVPELIHDVKQDLEEGMICGMAPIVRSVPIIVEAAHGHSWAEIH